VQTCKTTIEVKKLTKS